MSVQSIRKASNGKPRRRPHDHGRHHVPFILDPGGDFVSALELASDCWIASRKASRGVGASASAFCPFRADWAFKVFGDPEDRASGYVVYDRKSGREDSWHRWADDAQTRMHALQDSQWAQRDEMYATLTLAHAKTSPDGWRVLGPEPEDDDDLDNLEILAADLEYEANRPKADWAAELLADVAAIEAAAEFFGDDEMFEIAADFDADWRSRELFEAEESSRVMRGRSGSTRIDAEEEQRLYGYGV